MIRLSALWMTVFGLAVYSRKDWWVSLCGLVLLMAVIEHPDAPKSMFGIQGLNFWNVLLVVVVWAWLGARRREGLSWDLPAGTTLCVVGYFAIVVVSFIRMMADRRYLEETTGTLTSEYLVNTLKWVLPAVMLFDGCRTKRRFLLGLGSVLGLYLLLGLYVIKWMPLSMAGNGEELQERALKILVNEVGYHRVTMSMMLAGASWAIFAARQLFSDRRVRWLMILAAGAIVFAQALTGGRMGYVAWAAIGVVFFLIRDRAVLVAAPVGVLAVLLAIPAVGQRFMQGFSASTADDAAVAAVRAGVRLDSSKIDIYTVTAGRTLIWPYVEEKILERPIAGYGMLAMRRTGLATFLYNSLGEGFDHPHNAYLEVLFDNGIVGLVLMLPFYLIVVRRALALYADSRSPVFIAAGGAAAALVSALLISALGSESFYPREATVGMWCAIGLMLRVWVERERIAQPVAQPVHASLPASAIVWPDAIPEAAAAAVAPVDEAPPVTQAQPDVDQLLWRTT